MTAGNQNVFINCPFDDEYKPIFEVIRFTIQACGYIPRCALEESDAADLRLAKLYRLMGECSLSIHDLSRTEVGESGMPRFNMPFELGLFMGAKRFGSGSHKSKSALIMVKKAYALPSYLSDLAGSDPSVHEGKDVNVIGLVRDYLHVGPLGIPLPGKKHIMRGFEQFQEALEKMTAEKKLERAEVDVLKNYRTYSHFVDAYLKNNPVLE